MEIKNLPVLLTTDVKKRYHYIPTATRDPAFEWGTIYNLSKITNNKLPTEPEVLFDVTSIHAFKRGYLYKAHGMSYDSAFDYYKVLKKEASRDLGVAKFFKDSYNRSHIKRGSVVVEFD